MGEVLFGGGAVIGGVALAWYLRIRRLHSVALERLVVPITEVGDVDEAGIDTRPALPRSRWVMPVLAVVLAVGMWLITGWAAVFCFAVGVLLLILGVLLEVNHFEGRCLKIETQLADALDMMVGALGAGAGSMDAMESAARESPAPLNREIHNIVARIRYGEPPKDVYGDLALRVPLETFELFAFTMSIHDETGGSLTGTLSTVGRTIRDRIGLRRRVRSQATEAQASVIGILLIVYGIALVTWRTNPERMVEFVKSEIGINLISGAMIMQSLGLLWMFRMSRIKY